MTISAMHVEQGGRNVVTAYTVIAKSGQRGTEYTDPGDAALAFFGARVQDRPFVLRHSGSATYVIASARAGAKRLEPNWTTDDSFRDAFESLDRPATGYSAGAGMPAAT